MSILEFRKLVGLLFKLPGRARSKARVFGDFLPCVLSQAENAHNGPGGIIGVATGFSELDGRLGGLHPSELIILAGRPGMGSSILAMNIALNAARTYQDAVDGELVRPGTTTLFVSLEMSGDDLVTRLLASHAEIPGYKVRLGWLSDEGLNRLKAAAESLRRLPLFIDDTPGLQLATLRAKAGQLQAQHGLGLIIIDRLELFQSPSAPSEASQALKALARELAVPVVAISRLPSAVDERDDKWPQLFDLRSEGAIDQDADVIMFLRREQFYLERAEPGRAASESQAEFEDRHAEWAERFERVQNVAEVIIAKQRHGPIGTVRLSFSGELAKFSDLAES